MKKWMMALLLCLGLAALFFGCTPPPAPAGDKIGSSLAESNQSDSPQSEPPEKTDEEQLLEKYSWIMDKHGVPPEELVILTREPMNFPLFEQWVEDYLAGKPASFVLLHFQWTGPNCWRFTADGSGAIHGERLMEDGTVMDQGAGI